MTNITLAIDAMGGDFGPPITVSAALSFHAQYPDVKLILVGDKDVLQQALKSQSYHSQQIIIQHASQQVEMYESPALALRSKKDSSMRVAINLVKEGSAQACVSAGNTGALMATARFVLKTLPGIDRPAIVSMMPTIIPGKHIHMLDLGANVDSSAEHLLQFAVMGSVLSSAIDEIPRPRVALLNIGQEDIKGNEQVKQTAQLLSQLPAINYIGYIEGDDLYTGEADVIVCDGFVGNVALKTTEGVAILITKLLKQALLRNVYTKFLALLIKPVLKSAMRHVDPAAYNGASLIGLQGNVIKSHGGANVKSFANAIKQAMLSAEKNIPERIRDQVQSLLHPSSQE